MASSLPIVRQVAWLSVVPQLAVMAAFVFIAHTVGAEDPILPGMLAYFALSVTLRLAIPRQHNQGMQLVKQERFADAVPHFRLSYQFFGKHPWLDRWRALSMLSSSLISYREMALINLGFCFSQTGEVEQAIAEYSRALSEFPDSKVAETALRTLDATRAAATAAAAAARPD